MRTISKRGICILLALCVVFGNLTVTAFAGSPQPLPFTDVPQGVWHHPAVEYVYHNSIMQGISPTTFEPYASMNRAMAVAALFRLEHRRTANAEDLRENPFYDVPVRKWFAPYVTWAHSNNIVNGVSNNHFAPYDPVTREQFVTMCQRYVHYKGLVYPDVWVLPDFPDHEAVSDWAQYSMNVALVLGLIQGMCDGTLNPLRNINRAEAAMMLMRLTDILTLESLDIRQFLGRDFDEVSRFLGLPIDDRNIVDIELYATSVWFDTGMFVRVNDTVKTPWVVVYLRVSFREAGSERFHYAGISGASSRSEVRAALGEPDAINQHPPEDHGGLFNYGYRTETGNSVWFNFDFDSENVTSIQYIMDRDHHFNLSRIPMFYAAAHGRVHSAHWLDWLNRGNEVDLLWLGITLESVQAAANWVGLSSVVIVLERNGLTLEDLGFAITPEGKLISI